MESVNNLFDGYYDGCKTLESIRDVNPYERKYVDFSTYSPCYKFSNENLLGYYPKFNFSNGRVLTVCGSGDQVLSSILYGAKDIDCFDSNRVSFYNMMLKVYSIKYLDYKTFLDFFGISGRSVNRKNIYDSFKSNISNKSARYFFDVIFDEDFGISHLYNFDCDNEAIFYYIPYLNQNNFYKLKNLIDGCNINFRHSDIFNVFNSFDGRYDFINFSNIFDYIDNKISFYFFIENVKKNHLNNNGGIMINYSWSKPHVRHEINTAAECIDAYQISIPSCHYDINVDSDSIMYFGSIKH